LCRFSYILRVHNCCWAALSPSSLMHKSNLPFHVPAPPLPIVQHQQGLADDGWRWRWGHGEIITFCCSCCYRQLSGKLMCTFSLSTLPKRKLIRVKNMLPKAN
jgi:hypothetical protein